MDPIEALESLDSENDAHWISNGLPKVEVVRQLTGIDEITRSMIDQVAPDYTRTNRFSLRDDAPEEPGDDAAVPDTVETTEQTPDKDPKEDPEEDPEAREVGRHEAAEALKNDIAAAQARMLDIGEEQAALAEEMGNLEAQVRVMQITCDQLVPPLTHHQVVKQYQEAQIRQRQMQAAALQASAEKLGVEMPRGGAGLSKLDRMMSQRRGVNRRPRTPSVLAGSDG